MSQHDMVIDNQGFAATRSDINAALAALATNSSGATEPATTYAFQVWADTTADRLKIRNAANDAWVSVLVLSTGTPVSGVSAGPITASGLTQATARILGRSTAGTGAVEEITVSSNFTLADGGLDLARTFTAGTAVATTSGKAIDFTGIPSWAKRITVLFNDCSLSGTDYLLVQIGDGSISATGYLGSSSLLTTTSGFSSFTTGFGVFVNTAAARLAGTLTINQISANVWVSSHAMGLTAGGSASIAGGGTKTLSGTLDRIRITSTGSNTFDSGSVNIFYE